MTVSFGSGSSGTSTTWQRILLLLLILVTCDSQVDQSRSIQVINNAGFKVDVYWINTWDNGELVLYSENGVLHGADMAIDSYVGHEFQISEAPSKKSGKCRHDECQTAVFQVSENSGQLVMIEEGMEININDDKTRAHDQASTIVKECRAQLAEKKGDPYQLLDELTDCIQNSVDTSLDKKNEEKSFQALVGKSLGEQLEQYLCLDGKAEQTKSIENRTWTFQDEEYDIQVLLDRPSAKIMLIEDFISAEECRKAEERIITKRVNANGLSAKKGSMPFPAQETDVLYTLGDRMYGFVDDELEMEMEEGYDQEDLFYIHYEHKKESPYNNAAHCDGTCDGSDLEEGDRFATFILYCVVPEVGGATHFSRTGLHVPGKPGDALFYASVDSTSGISDTGMTKYAGCPVLQGDKKILTHKIRLEMSE